MNNLFQPLDVTVNGYTKSYLKKLFTECFAKQITDVVNSGKDPGSLFAIIDIKTFSSEMDH